jgi:hypothetical protein
MRPFLTVETAFVAAHRPDPALAERPLRQG